MPIRLTLRQPSLRGLLFALLFFAGLGPLALADALLIAAAPRDGRLLETAAIVVGGAALLALVAWLLSGWAAAALVEPARRLCEGMDGLARGRFETWVRPAGAIRELAELSDELNRMSGLTHKRVRELERAGRDNAALASDSIRLFRQLLEAREPMTRQHPGLLEAYSKAVARQLADRADAVESSEISLSPFADPSKTPRARDTRAQPRYPVADLMVDAPVGARILDVGSIGMKLETMENLPLGRQDVFELVSRSRRLRIPGRVAWCRLVRTVKTAAGDLVPVYRAGVRFAESVSTGSRDELLEIIRTHRQVA